MKTAKKNILIHNMLLLLTENEHISVSRMASVLGISESTIRRNLSSLEEAVKESGYGVLQKIPGKGLHLQIQEKEKIEGVVRVFGNYELRNIATDEHQIYRYLFMLLSSTAGKLTLEQISKSTYDSIPVVRKKLQVCNEWLSLFGLTLKVKRNYGISLEGNEENVRMAIRHAVLHNDQYKVEESIRFFAKGTDLEKLKQCISSIEKSWNFKFTEESFHSMLVYAALSVARYKKYPLQQMESEYETVHQYNEYGWAKALFDEINESFALTIGESEVVFFAIQLLCAGMIYDGKYEENQVHRYDEKMKEFIRKIISVISDILNVDLTKDRELYYGLLNHIRPAIFRMRFEKHSTKPLTDFIKEEYKETFRVSWALSILFEEYYGINISSTELSYITLYIQAALERISKPVKLAFVTELGMGLNQMFCNKIKLAIPRVENIDILSLHEFHKSTLDQYDLIVTTSDLGIANKKIVQIGSLLNETGITRIHDSLKELSKKKFEDEKRFDVICHSLFDPRLIFENVEVKNKQELIELLASNLSEMGYITDKYAASIFKREKTVSTYIGNGVAIPHGNSCYVNDSKVAIAFLKDGIVWNEEEKEKVDTVFLLAFRIENKDNSKQVQLFYKVFLELIQTDESIRHLKTLTTEELYKFLVR